MSLTLPDLIYTKYPRELKDRKIILQDDGEGPYIREWNLEVSKPTKAQLDAWAKDPDLITQHTFKQNKIKNTEIYKKLDEIDLKSIRSLRIKDDSRLQELENEAIALRAQLLPTS